MGKQYGRLDEVAKQQQQQITEMRQREQRGQQSGDANVSTTTTASTNHTPRPNDRTDGANGQSERVRNAQNGTEQSRSLLTELTDGVEETRRLTERFSFEIYTDQKERIYELQFLYHRRTRRKLSVSRIIREALDAYLKKAFTNINDS